MNKKQTIIISSLLVLIIFAGYLATKVNGPLYVTDDQVSENGTINTSLSSTFFTEARLQRDQKTTQTLASLKSLVDNENTPQEQKAQAAEEYKNIAILSEKEVRIELALKAQGYEDAICTLDKEKNSASVVVKNDGELTDQQARQIQDIIMSKSDMKNIEVKVASK